MVMRAIEENASSDVHPRQERKNRRHDNHHQTCREHGKERARRSKDHGEDRDDRACNVGRSHDQRRADRRFFHWNDFRGLAQEDFLGDLGRLHFLFAVQRKEGAGGHRQGTGYGGRRCRNQHHRGFSEGPEKAAHRPENLDEPIVQSEKDVADLLCIDLPIGQRRDEYVLVLEFVHEYAPQRLSKRLALVFSPEREVLADAMNLDRLEHQMHGG